MTLPKAQHMAQGFDRPEEETGSGLYVKQRHAHRDASVQILTRSPSSYTLTYPQKRDAMWSEPFFMCDAKHTHFIERVVTCSQKWENKDAPKHGAPTDLALSRRTNRRYKAQYEIALHEHPYACLMLSSFNQHGIDGLYGMRGGDPDTLNRQARSAEYFHADYRPLYGRVSNDLPVLNFDFERGGAYSRYNWEIFYHLPSLIAQQLKEDGKFAEALKYLRLIFDPTTRDNVQAPQRYWQIKPFFGTNAQNSFQKLTDMLGGASSANQDVKLRQQLEAQIAAWRDNPFEPHKIAESRIQAYMLRSFMEYIEILTQWGDDLFRQGSIESINEAQNLYVMAGESLANKPVTPEAGSAKAPQSFAELLIASTSDKPMINYENMMMGFHHNTGCNDNPCGGASGASIFASSHFCVPQNPKLLALWDVIEDRLFKIRHCQNLDGDVRILALFQPPIDPGMLVKARAAGMSISEVMSNLTAEQLPYRFNYLLQKAQDFTGEVKALGGQLLSALEKKDAEELSQIRQTHELNIQKATRNLKKMSIAEAKESFKALEHSLKGAEITLAFYEGREYMISGEQQAFSKTKIADNLTIIEQSGNLVASTMVVFPDLYASFPPILKMPGGDKLSAATRMVASSFGMAASINRSNAGRLSTLASYSRRAEDWGLQIDTGRERVKELNRQIIAAEIRLQTAEKDLEIFDQQVEQTKEIYSYLQTKFTNEQLYTWMAGQLKTFHYQVYKLAADMARQAQMAFNRELNTNETILSFNHWDSGRAGLLAGEALSFDLKKLDDKYLRARAKLEVYELSRSVSLRRLDPAQLYNLRSNKAIEVNLPEWLFNTSHNGKKLTDMMIKSVTLSLPVTTGPMASVPIKLQLVSKQGPAQDTIITSTAQNDAGRFDPNPNGERYLPFENESVVSTWEVTLPDNPEFDPSTITDLVFNIRYTAIDDNGTSNGDEVEATQLPPSSGQFAVSMRYDLYDHWLELQKAIQLANDNNTNLDIVDEDLPDGEIMGTGEEVKLPASKIQNATPYIYDDKTRTIQAVYAITRTNDGELKHEPILEIYDTGVLTKIEELKSFQDKLVDLIVIYDVTMP